MKQKKHNVYFLSLVAFINIIYSSFNLAQIQSDSLLVFRYNKFGDKPELVKENETAKYLQDFKGFNRHIVSYSSEYAGLEVRIDYIFHGGLLREASYNIEECEDVVSSFKSFLLILETELGKPKYYANKLITDKDIWIKENEYGAFKGPELYWIYKNGFIVLHASKFKDEESLTALYVSNRKLNNYGNDKIEMPNWTPTQVPNIHQ